MLLLPNEIGPTLVRIARTSLESAFRENSGQSSSDKTDEPPKTFTELEKPYPCFVTLHSRSGRLRGCIGNLETDEPLHQNIWRLARSAAFQDPRFSPLKPAELEQVKISISVLGPTKPLPHLNDLTLGTHGLVVSHGRKRGVLLADVATDFGWTREEFLEQTCEKAGLDPSRKNDYLVEYFEQVAYEEK